MRVIWGYSAFGLSLFLWEDKEEHFVLFFREKGRARERDIDVRANIY